VLVGYDTCDDAGVYQLTPELALVQTVDFFTPIVDDPVIFGRIAAANSISDIYAMGARPILGLAIAAFPTDQLPLSVLEGILRGGAEKAAEAGFPVAGGHTIIDDVPKYGLAVTGLADARKIVRNSTAQAGDSLYLTKPIGNGILVCAHRALSNGRWKNLVKRAASPSLDQAIEVMSTLNRAAAEAMLEVGVNAATDITGYGLVGHLLEMCAGANLGARIHAGAVPVLDDVREYLEKGYVPAGTMRNVGTFRDRVDVSVSNDEFALMCDAQTSGGLLIAVSRDKESALEAAMRTRGVHAARVGEMTETGRTLEIVS
jgi:selenide,water dikinase